MYRLAITNRYFQPCLSGPLLKLVEYPWHEHSLRLRARNVSSGLPAQNPNVDVEIAIYSIIF